LDILYIAAETGSTNGRRRIKIASAMKLIMTDINQTVRLVNQRTVKMIRPLPEYYCPNVCKAYLIAV